MLRPIAGAPGLASIPDWTFLIAFSFFRYAAIAQGVYKRSLDGNASNPERARQFATAAPQMSRLAMEAIEADAQSPSPSPPSMRGPVE